MKKINPEVVVARHETPQARQSAYVIGYVTSLYLTLTAYLLVKHQLFSKWILVIALTILAVAQFVAQLLFFLHLGRETKPRWKLAVFGAMIAVVLILVFGSIWIISNLSYRHNHASSPEQINNYLNNQDRL